MNIYFQLAAFLLSAVQLWSPVQGRLCPNKRDTCPSFATCCEMIDGRYGCCPYKEAICCSDQIHCCPQGTKCGVSIGSCIGKGLAFPFPWMVPIYEGDLVTQAISDTKTKVQQLDNAEPSLSETQCSGVGTCPYGVATCCPDGVHCCPDDYTCDVDLNRCVAKPNSNPLQPSILAVFNYVTDEFEVPDLMTCWNPMCPMMGKKCCGTMDGMLNLCCPFTTDCDNINVLECVNVSEKGKPRLHDPDFFNIFDTSMYPAESSEEEDDFDFFLNKAYGAVSNEITDDIEDAEVVNPVLFSCSSSTCSKLGQQCCSTFEGFMKICCPDTRPCKMLNPFQCSFRVEEGKPKLMDTNYFNIFDTSKYPAKGIKDDEDPKKEIKIEEDPLVFCPDKTYCSIYATCCGVAGSRFGCCDLPEATCCDDHASCCPNGYVCSESGCSAKPITFLSGVSPRLPKSPLNSWLL